MILVEVLQSHGMMFPNIFMEYNNISIGATIYANNTIFKVGGAKGTDIARIYIHKIEKML